MPDLTITGHSQDVYCSVCGVASTVTGIDEHHVVHRSMGGTDGVTLLLCRRCHNALHPEKVGGPGYTLSLTNDNLYLLDDHGKVLVERPRSTPEGWDEGVFVAGLQNAPQALRQAAIRFRFLSDDGLIAAGEAMASVSHVAWELRGRLFLTALRRTPWGNRDKVLLDVAKQFGIERAQARREAQLIGWLDEHPEVSSRLDELPPVEALRHIVAAESPVEAAELWGDRKAEDASYSIRQFAAEVKGVERTYCEHNACPVCGAGLPHYSKAGTA